MNLGTALREPLAHFLLAGLVMFLAVSAWEGPAVGERTIRITKDHLLVYLQGRAQVYDEETFAQLLEAMPAPERQELLEQAALQEALYREGEALDIASADPLIRQRIVQQMRLLLMEEAAAKVSLTDRELDAFYTAHRDDYRLPAQVTFTHVFLAGNDSGNGERAQATLRRLLAADVPFENAGRYGERFLYQLNYSDADADLIGSHFGRDFAKRLFALPTGTWQGPLRSEHGRHLVLLRSQVPAREPDRVAIAAELREDALADKRNRLAQAALDRMMERYTVQADAGLTQ